MSLHATFIEHTFVSILALYVTLECAVTILQTRAAEKSCGRVPEGFEKKLTLAGIRKAADYTGELAQANLLLTVVGAGFALFMTFGNGLNVFTAVMTRALGFSSLLSLAPERRGSQTCPPLTERRFPDIPCARTEARNSPSAPASTSMTRTFVSCISMFTTGAMPQSMPCPG